MSNEYPSCRVAVVGLGYVGCVTAACLAKLGHSVVGVDIEESKVRLVLEGEAPFYEPILSSLIQDGIDQARLSATGDLAAGLKEAEYCLVCVAARLDADGHPDLEPLRQIVREIAILLSRRGVSPQNPPVIVVRTTVFPGTCEKILEPELEGLGIPLICNPEFLREGSAVKDFLEPALVVIGGSDSAAAQRVSGLYASICCQPKLVDLWTAEMVKYVCNSFHALKLTFANEIGVLCESLGVPGDRVMEVVCQDTRLNISPAYLKPGFAFGGSCLPKDVRTLTVQASGRDLNLPLLQSILPSNSSHLQRAIDAALALNASSLGVYGLAFKAHTDDVRESPALTLIRELLDRGIAVKVFDPNIQLERIVGQNLRYLISRIPEIEGILVAEVDELLEGTAPLVITQPLPIALRAVILGENRVVLDLTGAFQHDQ